MLTMRTLSLGSSSARPSSSSTTSQFRSPHLHRGGGHSHLQCLPIPTVEVWAARDGLRLPQKPPQPQGALAPDTYSLRKC